MTNLQTFAMVFAIIHAIRMSWLNHRLEKELQPYRRPATIETWDALTSLMIARREMFNLQITHPESGEQVSWLQAVQGSRRHPLTMGQLLQGRQIRPDDPPTWMRIYARLRGIDLSA